MFDISTTSPISTGLKLHAVDCSATLSFENKLLRTSSPNHVFSTIFSDEFLHSERLRKFYILDRTHTFLVGFPGDKYAT